MSMKINTTLPSPAELKEEIPLSEKLAELKKKRDQEIRDIFTGKSDKFAVIIGPCSADNEDSVCEYVDRLAKVNEKVKDKLMIIPRIYTNKPRTTGEGYKGMLHQPDPDKAPDLYAGIIAIRHMHIRALEESGLTGADEMLYPENRSYLDDEGMNNWTGQILNGKDPAEVVWGFIFSDEFKNRNLNNDQFIKVMYETYFDREADTAGYNDWMNRMNSGATREDVVNGFSGSQEFYNLVKSFGL